MSYPSNHPNYEIEPYDNPYQHDLDAAREAGWAAEDAGENDSLHDDQWGAKHGWEGEQ